RYTASWAPGAFGGPSWTTSRPRRATHSQHSRKVPDVADWRAKAEDHPAIRNQAGRYRVARGPGGAPHRAHQRTDRALQDPQEGQPLAARSAQDGEPAPPASRPRQGKRRGPLSE